MIKLDKTKEIDHMEYVICLAPITRRMDQLFIDHGYKTDEDATKADFTALPLQRIIDRGEPIPDTIIGFKGKPFTDKDYYVPFFAYYPKEYLQEIYEKIVYDDDYADAFNALHPHKSPLSDRDLE